MTPKTTPKPKHKSCKTCGVIFLATTTDRRLYCAPCKARMAKRLCATCGTEFRDTLRDRHKNCGLCRFKCRIDTTDPFYKAKKKQYDQAWIVRNPDLARKVRREASSRYRTRLRELAGGAEIACQRCGMLCRDMRCEYCQLEVRGVKYPLDWTFIERDGIPRMSYT